MKIITNLKNLYYSIKRKVSYFQYKYISTILFPRQKWLTKKIGRKYKDKDAILEIVVLECVKNYVEEEKAFEHTDFTWNKQSRKFGKELKEIYNLITVELPKLEQKLEEEWKNVPSFNLDDINSRKDGDYKKIYGKIDDLGKEIDETKTKIMIWTVNNRGKLWT